MYLVPQVSQKIVTNTADISIIIPALNEAESVTPVIKDVPPTLDDQIVEVIVVDDGSTDNTAEQAEQAGARVIRHESNRGYGAALKTGFEHATGDIVGFLDADYTYPSAEFTTLYERFVEDDADIVVGTRLAGHNEGMPFIRRTGNRFFAWLVCLLTKSPVTDPASGMRLLRKELLSDLYPLSDDLDFTPEMTTKATQLDLEYIEVPITYRERVGESKLGAFEHGYRFFTVITRTVRDYQPMRVFGSLGVVSFVIGVLLSLFVVGDWFLRQVEHQYTLTFAILAIFLGVQLFMFGALADMILNRMIEQ